MNKFKIIKYNSLKKKYCIYIFINAFVFRQTSYTKENKSDKTSTFIDFHTENNSNTENILTDTSDVSNSEEETINSSLKKFDIKIRDLKAINNGQDKLNIISCISSNDSAAIENTVTFHAKLNCNLYIYVICIYTYTHAHQHTH
jgi:hypothetical protein